MISGKNVSNPSAMKSPGKRERISATVKRFRLLIFTLFLIFATTAFFLYHRNYTSRFETVVRPSGQKFHFVLILQPDSGNNLETALIDLKKQWNVWLEVHTFETVAEQKSMLRLLPDTDIDGVLLWPISENNEDYEEELVSLRKKNLPIVVIERNVAPYTRSSYIGSGSSSDNVVLGQSLRLQNSDAPFLIGNRFSFGSNQFFEFLLFSRNNTSADLTGLRNLKLREIAEEPPEGYSVERYISFSGEEARSLNVREKLAQLIEEMHPCLVFSLDSTLTSIVISAEHDVEMKGGNHCYILGYGEREDHKNDLQTGSLDGLVISRPKTSMLIGVRYLLDLRRDMWVPPYKDSGIDFIRKEDL